MASDDKKKLWKQFLIELLKKFIHSISRCPDNCPRGKLPPRLGLWFALGLGLGLGAIFLGGNCPRTKFAIDAF